MTVFTAWIKLLVQKYRFITLLTRPTHRKPPPKWRRGIAPFGDPVVRGGRARGGPWLSGLRPDAVSRMRLRALGGGGGIARAGWRGVIPAEDSHRRRGGVLPTGVERRPSGLSSASSAGT